MRPLKKTLAWAIVNKRTGRTDCVRPYPMGLAVFETLHEAKAHLQYYYELEYWRIARVEIKEVKKNP